MGIILENTPDELIKSMSCFDMKSKCLQRKCTKCLPKTLTVNEFDKEEIASLSNGLLKRLLY